METEAPVSFDILKGWLANYQQTVKAARAKYFLTISQKILTVPEFGSTQVSRQTMSCAKQ